MVERALHLVEPFENPQRVPTPMMRQVEAGVKTLAADGGHANVITVPGCGKTEILRWLVERYPEQCFLLTLHEWARSRTTGLRALLTTISAGLSIHTPVTTESARVFSLVMERLELLRTLNRCRPVVLVDEGQVAKPELLNGFRHFADIDACALVVAANHRLYDAETGQVDPGLEPLFQRRKWIIERLEPDRGDVDAILDAYAITEKAARDVLYAAARERALRGVVRVIETAQELGGVRVPSLDDLNAAAAFLSPNERIGRGRRRR